MTAFETEHQVAREFSQDEVEGILNWKPTDETTKDKWDFSDDTDPLLAALRTHDGSGISMLENLVDKRATVEGFGGTRSIQAHGYDQIYSDVMEEMGVTFDPLELPKNDSVSPDKFGATNNANDFLGVDRVQSVIDRVDSGNFGPILAPRLKRALLGEMVAQKAREAAQQSIDAYTEKESQKKSKRIRKAGAKVAGMFRIRSKR